MLLVAAHLLFNSNIVIPLDESRMSPGEDPAVVIAQISDLHLGRKIRRPQRRAARSLNRINPDIILITGDSIGSVDAVPVLEKWLALLKTAENQRYAVLGNWEYLIRDTQTVLTEAYAFGGVKLLVNEAVEINSAGRNLRIVGLDDFFGGIVSGTVFRGSDENTDEIIMIHEPIVAEFISERVSGSTIFAGHTHGGQILIFGRALYTPPGSGIYVEGSYEVGGNRLIVSRGIGASTLPVRIGPEPDIRILRFSAGD